MAIGALTEDCAGFSVVPESPADWDEGVFASSTRNHVLDDPLLDWLGRHGEARGYEPDTDFDERTDFRTFIFRKGHEFEGAIVEHLHSLTGVYMVTDDQSYEARCDLAVAEATFEAMARGEPIIYQGILRDAETRTYGAPDLLIRSDILAELFPRCLTAADAAVSALDLGAPRWHYRVVDSKFSMLQLAASAAALSDSSDWERMGTSPIALALTLFAPEGTEPPSDATNYLGGVADVLQGQRTNVDLSHLGELSEVSLYANDRQLVELSFRIEPAAAIGYQLSVSSL